jgi:Protein of unknown function (DUF3187)
VVLALRHDAFARLASVALFSSPAAIADPLPVVDQNPLISGFEAPFALPARIDDAPAWSLEASFSWGSTALTQGSPNESLLIDAETREWRVALQRGLPAGVAVRVQVPYRRTSGGSLDGFIDDWHDAFGLPEGARPTLPEDALRLFYRRNGNVLLDSRASQQGLGDVSVDLGKALSTTPASAIAVWMGVKLPTGDAAEFTGSGSVNGTVGLSAEHRFAGRWRAYGQAAGTWMDNGDRLTNQQRHFMWSAAAGLSARTVGALVLTAQLDAHTAVFDTDGLDYLGAAVQLSVGGSYRFASDWLITLGVSEDIGVESAPDVVFLFDLKKTF